MQFISFSAGKTHAREQRMDAHTLCGLSIPEAAQPERIRELSNKALCGRCILSLRTYRTAVAFERESEARR